MDADPPRPQAQESLIKLIKLITGMNNDVNPLGFRGPYEGDRVTKDVYYPFAPGWSTLSRGIHPHITLPPETIVDYIIRAADCVPLIRSVPIFVINDDGSKEQVSRDALKLMNIQVKPVPNLHVKAPAPAAARATGPSPHEVEQQRLLDRQRLELERMREEISVLKDHVAARDAAAAASASASATPPAEDEGQEVEPAAKRPHRGGK